MGVAHRLEYSWVRLLASKSGGACSAYIISWPGAIILQTQEACLSCIVSPLLQMMYASRGSQLPLLVAVVILGGLDEIC